MRRLIIYTLFILVSSVIGIWLLVHFAGLQASLLWAAIIGAAAWAVRSSIEQKREYQRLLAEKKREQYLEFLDILNHFIGEGPEGAAQPNEKFSILELRKWSLRLTLLGSDEVVRAWNSARLAIPDEQAESVGISGLKKWGKLWLAMRKDCGHLDTQLQVSEILSSFVNDIEQHRTTLDGN